MTGQYLNHLVRYKLCDMLQTHMSYHGVQIHLQVGILLEVRRDKQCNNSLTQNYSTYRKNVPSSSTSKSMTAVKWTFLSVI